jgi:SiaC family regulatory phosphoprotein
MTDIVHILPTKKTPEILLDPKGIIKIKGRAIDESRIVDPEQVIKWIDAYLINPPESTDVTIALEFLNSFNTIILTSILKKISHILKQGKSLTIKWYYEEDDIDIFERGEYISLTINVPIKFIVTEDIADC